MLARTVVAEGKDAEKVATAIVDGLRAPDLRCALVFADWRLDSAVIASITHSGLAPAIVIGGTTTGVVTPMVRTDLQGMAAVGLGLYGDAFRVGLGIATDLPKSALTKSRDAVHAAAAALGTTADRLDSTRHHGVVLVEGKCGHEEACCIGSAAAAPQIRFVGGSAAAEPTTPRRPYVFVRGEALIDAATVLLIETSLPCQAVQSSHLLPTDLKTVVTAASGRDIIELDGYPAARRLGEIVAKLGEQLDPRAYTFARYIGGTPYVRSVTHLDGDHVHVASAVETGHVLHIMRPGDLIGQTKRDLTTAADRCHGVSAFLAFSCFGRHWEAAVRGIEGELAETYAAYPTVGFQSFGEQSGMLLCNHTLTGLVIGKPA